MEAGSESSIFKVPPGAVENIKKIYNLDKIERLEEAIKILQDWIQKQDHIIKKDFSKHYLEKTLITCKGSVEKSKKQIDRLCTMKTLMPQYFTKVNVKTELHKVLEIAWVCPLPTLTDDYYRVVMVKFTDKEFTSDLIMQYFQFAIILVEYIKAHDYVNGFIGIFDFRDINLFDLISKLNPVELQQCATIVIEGYGARLKSVQILTVSKAIDVLIKIFKHLVSEKIVNRIYVQPTLEDLHKAIPKEILPVEYGGNERSIEKLRSEFVEELSSEEHVEYMKMMNKACSDETKRHDGKFNEEYMGTPGAFRCLSVD
ncbi:hypothetical protein PYW07_008288 [Mythimna separata]|uniref:CRAL-TRIO domain-containing protein n=1 Tax=Mythimna separata TaxID=271217 RepID=A0AAD8DN10_MYTSE|nr:hypothetical protein PYW07_008288 [Mythimna separata]